MVLGPCGIALPVACAITTGETGAAFTTLLACLVHTGGGISPGFIMSDDGTAVTAGVTSTFCPPTDEFKGPQHLFCIWHAAKALHTAINGPKYLGNNVDKPTRERLYKDVTEMLNTRDEWDFDKKYMEFKEAYGAAKFSKFCTYFDGNYYENRHKFMACYRPVGTPKTDNTLESKDWRTGWA